MKWLSSPTIANSLKLGGGTAIGQIVVIATTPIITRQYSPAALGLVSVFMAFVSFGAMAVGLRFDSAIPSAETEEDADYLLATTVLLSIPVAIIACIVMAMLILGRLLSYELLPLWSILPAFLILISTGTFTAFRFWHVRAANFSLISKALVSQGFARALIPVAVGIINTSWLGLLCGEIGGRIFGIARLFAGAQGRMREVVRRSNYPIFVEVIKKYKKMPLILLPSSMIDALSSAIPFPIISHFYGIEAAGLFMLSQRIVTIPAALISGSVADVFHNRISEIQRDTPEEMLAFTVKAAKKLFQAALLIYIPMAILAPFLEKIIFGSKWVGVGSIIAMLAPALIAGVVSSPISRILIVINRVERKLWYDFANLILSVASLTAAYYLGGSFMWAMAAYSLAQTAIYSFYFLVIRYTVA